MKHVSTFYVILDSKVSLVRSDISLGNTSHNTCSLVNPYALVEVPLMYPSSANSTHNAYQSPPFLSPPTPRDDKNKE